MEISRPAEDREPVSVIVNLRVEGDYRAKYRRERQRRKAAEQERDDVTQERDELKLELAAVKQERDEARQYGQDMRDENDRQSVRIEYPAIILPDDR